MVAYGEGWHNYHHVFPWDYKTAELGDYTFNLSTAFIDIFAKIGKAIHFCSFPTHRNSQFTSQIIGWAYELKTVSDDMIRKRAERTGDGSNQFSRCIKNGVVRKDNVEHHAEDSSNNIWGWDDEDMKNIDRDDALIIKKIE